MWNLWEGILLFLGCIFIIKYLKVIWAAKSLPPGPIPLPFIGNLWTLSFQLHPETLRQLAKLHGNIYTVWLGETPLVVLNGLKAVKDGIVSHSEELSGRPVAGFLRALLSEKGIFTSNGGMWKQQRRFGLMTLKNLGLGKCSLESRIQEEVGCLVESFKSKNGESFDPSEMITNSVVNVISAVVFGHRFSIDDGIFQYLVQCNHVLLEIIGSAWGRLYDSFPWLMKHLPGRHQKAFEIMEYLHKFTDKEIRMHKENRSFEEPQDVIDYYLAHISKTAGEKESIIDEDSLITVVIEFFNAGTETTATSLLWALLYMVAYPDVQKKVHKELDAVLNGSAIYYEDRKRLHYTNAAIHEIQRCGNVAAVGLLRTCTRDVSVSGYSLHMNTMVLPNLDSVLHDSEYWDTPDQFNPHHFLDKDGMFLVNEAFLPFSAGARVCLGEQLARYELFLFFTTLMRTFSFHLPEGVTEVNTKYIFKTNLLPHPYTICAIPR
ncbi:PREDICTED: cytochrome P450 2J6-like [Nanorana parkeri]|uniref:cytochrome P450 2J6-like n=1 Tax=Nanorana parkeri TaxID=125878 RepID=UPI00085473FA|nr:PREDICTED: cytochrome P450 2J6-like [Nanorana parkeri]